MRRGGKGKAALAVLALLALSGDKKAAAAAPDVDDDLDDDDVEPGDVEPDEPFQVIPGKEPELPDEPIQVVPTTGELPPSTGPVSTDAEDTATDVYDAVISLMPAVGRAYQIQSGDVLRGANGLIAQALGAHYGEPPSLEEIYAYYKLMTRIRTNWVLYGTDSTPSAEVVVTDEQGATVAGSITSAFYKMHDSWPAATGMDAMPSRLIGFTRMLAGNKKIPIPLSGWQQRAHGPAGTTRVFGTLLFPHVECIDAANPFTNAQCDWPEQLFAATGYANRWGWTGA